MNPEPNPLALFSLTLPSPVRRVSTRSLEIPPKDVACPVEKLPISGLARNEQLGQQLRLIGLEPDSLTRRGRIDSKRPMNCWLTAKRRASRMTDVSSGRGQVVEIKERVRRRPGRVV